VVKSCDWSWVRLAAAALAVWLLGAVEPAASSLAAVELANW